MDSFTYQYKLNKDNVLQKLPWVESHGESTIHDSSVDVSSEIDFHHVVVFENGIVTIVRGVVSSTMVDRNTRWKSKASLEAIFLWISNKAEISDPKNIKNMKLMQMSLLMSLRAVDSKVSQRSISFTPGLMMFSLTNLRVCR